MTILIKIGGSVITDKAVEGSIRYDEITRLAKVLLQAQEPVVLVHGAGSLGHPEAKRYAIQNGVTVKNSEGVYVTHEAVSRLNTAVVSSLRHEGIEAVAFSPFAAALAENGRLIFCGEKQIYCLLEAGIMPVLFGDVVCDTKKGGCIVSGDQIVPYLAQALNASRVGFVTQTGGVIQGTSIVEKITRKSFSGISFGPVETADVTGGMKGKIEELLLLADAGIPSSIFAPEELASFLAGNPCGTQVVI